MPTINTQATRLKDAKVAFISLVPGGANRVPFRIVKQEDSNMNKKSLVDLGMVFRSKKGEAAKKAEPVIIAVATQGGDSLEAVKAGLKEAGFSVDKQEEQEDGAVVFRQTEDPLDEATTVVRLSEEVALVCKGFSPYNMDVTQEGTSFADQCAARGFYPGINSIMDSLSDSVTSLVYSSASPEDASKAVAKLFAEASSYVASFVGNLPAKAFKMEGFCSSHIKVAPEAPVTSAKAETSANADGGAPATTEDDPSYVCKVCGGSKKKAGMVTKEDGTLDDICSDCFAAATTATKDDVCSGCSLKGKSKEVCKGCKAKNATKTETGATAPEGTTAPDVASMVATQVSQAIKAATGEVTSTMAELRTTMQGLGSAVGELSGRVSEAEKVAKAAKESVGGVLVQGTPTGDPVEGTAKKQEGWHDIDTGMSRAMSRK